ncbi:MAG: FAD:protein FMN transferase [Chloroflexota bacterium]
MHATSFHAMGSKIAVTVDGDGPNVRAALREARTWFLAWEACLSRFRPESELNQLNRGQPMQVSRPLWDVLQAACAIARLTNGLITPTILPALEAAGYKETFRQSGSQTTHVAAQYPLPMSGKETGALPYPASEMQTDAATRTVCLPQGMRLDFGGFAKGWAADETARRLSKIAPTLVDAGGDVAASGPRTDGTPWPLGVAHPTNPGHHLAILQLHDGGLATSGRNQRHWVKNGRPQHHLIDPRSGRPAITDVITASVVATSALAAETAAKMALILGSQAGEKWLQAHGLSGMLALEDGNVRSIPAAAPPFTTQAQQRER